MFSTTVSDPFTVTDAGSVPPPTVRSSTVTVPVIVIGFAESTRTRVDESGTPAGSQFAAVWKLALLVPSHSAGATLNDQLTFRPLSAVSSAGIGRPTLASLSCTSTPFTERYPDTASFHACPGDMLRSRMFVAPGDAPFNTKSRNRTVFPDSKTRLRVPSGASHRSSVAVNPPVKFTGSTPFSTRTV